MGQLLGGVGIVISEQGDDFSINALGIPPGGADGNVLTKIGADDFETVWAPRVASAARQVLIWTGSIYPAKTHQYAEYVGPVDPASVLEVDPYDTWLDTSLPESFEDDAGIVIDDG